MQAKTQLMPFLFVLFFASISGGQTPELPTTETLQEFRVEAERFADLRVLRYQVPGFDELDLRTKTLIYYLYEASLSGREIIYD